MQFMMMVKCAESSGLPPKQLTEAMAKLTEEAAKGGTMVGGGMLGATALGARVRLSRGEVTVIDGPMKGATGFVAKQNVATAGGCLSSQYLAAWFIARLEGVEAARNAIQYVAPVGEKETYVTRAIANISPFL